MPTDYIGITGGGLPSNTYATDPWFGDQTNINLWNAADKKIDFTLAERLTNYDIGSLCYGKPIPISWGRRRVGGELIVASGLGSNPYASGIRRVYNGKQKFQVQIDFNYTSTFAVSFGYPGNQSRPRFLSKLWADGTLVWAAGQTYLPFTFSWHDGSETQLQDAALVALDADAVPYRGQMYIVCKDFPIGEYGNRIPQFSAEIVDAVSPAQDFVEYEPIDDPQSGGASGAVDWDRELVYKYQLSGGEIHVYVYDMNAETEINHYQPTDTAGDLLPDSGTGQNAVQIFPSINVLFGAIGNGFALVDANSGVEIDSFQSGGVGFEEPFATQVPWIPSPDPYRSIFFCYKNFFHDEIRVVGLDVRTNQIAVQETIDTIGLLGAQNRMAGDASRARFWTGHGRYVGHIDIDHASNIDYEPEFHDLGATMTVHQLWYSERFDALVVSYNDPGIDSAANRMRRINPETGATMWDIVTGAITFDPNAHVDGGFIATTTGAGIHLFNIETGEKKTITGSSGFTLGAFYDGVANASISITGAVGRYYYGSGDYGQLALSDFLTDLCVYAGYDLGDIEVAASITETVTGALIVDNYDLRAILKSVCELYRIEMVETNGKIKFYRKNRDGTFTVDATIDIDDLALVNSSDEDRAALITTITDETAAPRAITVNFINPDLDYNRDTYTWQRPSAQVQGSTQSQMGVPLILQKDNVATLVNKLLYDVWTGIYQSAFRLPPKYFRFEPGDIITITDGSFAETIKLTSTTIEGDWSITCTGERVLQENVVEVESDDITPVTFEGPGDGKCQVVVLDSTLIGAEGTGLRDAQDGSLVSYSTVLSYGQSGWRGGRVYRAENPGGGTELIGTLVTEPTWGFVKTTLPDRPACYTKDDETMIVRLRNGELESVSQDEWLTGVNQAWVGREGRWEWIWFRDAAQNGDGDWVLTGLVRGAQGSDTHTGDHRAGDLFILYREDDANIFFEAVDDSKLGQEYLYQAVGIARASFLEGPHVEVKEGEGEKPWAVNDVQAADSAGDVAFTWQRRDRTGYGDGFLDSTDDDPPMSEETEEYEFEIFADATFTDPPVRTETGLTSETYTWTAADQVTDGFASQPATVYVKVYQISAVVGRGFAQELTLNVE